MREFLYKKSYFYAKSGLSSKIHENKIFEIRTPNLNRHEGNCLERYKDQKVQIFVIRKLPAGYSRK